MPLSLEQVLSLAPDPAAGKAGRELANPRKWQSFGRAENAVWGECRGSAAAPYQTAVDLAQPAFRCTCPSRKFPCKHALGLFLLLAGEPGSLPLQEPPAWVAEWLQSRARRVEKTEQPAEPKDPAQLAAEQVKRAARRLARVQDGLNELDLWLRDLVREGIGDLPSRKREFWSQPAQRMVDAQAPGLARMLEEMAAIPYSGAGWPDRMLSRIGRLSLLLEGYRRLSELPQELQRVTRTAVGFAETREDVLAEEKVADEWLVLGRSVRSEERLRVQRTWLRGRRKGQTALVLDFAAGQQPLDGTLIPGTAFEGSLAFYPGAPLRALVADHSPSRPIEGWSGFSTVAEALTECARVLSREPWSGLLPCPLVGVTPARVDGTWAVADSEGAWLPLDAGADGWTLVAISGGLPIDVIGEWDGERLLPLGAFGEGRYVQLVKAR